jgi:CRP-like cAMP-binding protein/membrane protein YdbS with pleckstrin-like domain
MLTDAETSKVWQLFGKSPLFAQWPGVRSQLPYLLEAQHCAEGGVVYEPGGPPECLYLVAEGGVIETARYEKQPWLKTEYVPGQFFGQRALFTNLHRSRAAAQAGTTLYRMSAATLRVAMEQNSDLSEELLREKRASRLRRLPLLRYLPDEQIRQLAQVIQEQDLPEGASLPLQEKPGLWIVDWGQLRVTGPAAHKGPEWSDWGITAGNFIVAPGVGLHAADKCAVTSATAHVKSHLFCLPAQYAIGLLSTFPAVHVALRHPIDIVEVLSAVALFGEPLEDRHREHLAQFCAWEFVPAGQNITTQGSVGHSFVILRRGTAVVMALDEAGRPRPRRYLERGESYGRTSLLKGKPREATVRAKTSSEGVQQPGPDGAELIILDRRDLQFAFAERPDLWHPGVILFDEMVRETEQKKRYDWLEEGEIVRWADRPHILWLLLPQLGVFFAGLLALLFLRLMPPQLQASLTTTYLICILPAVLLAAIWVLVNYRDDYYVVTNRRVTRRDRVWPLYEAKLQAPIDTVQQVTLDQGFFGRLFDYGHVSINTAAKVGAMIFAHVPDPQDVQGYVLQGKAEAMLAGRGQQREVLRRGLATELSLALLVPERVRALGDEARLPGRSIFAGAPPGQAPSAELLPGTKNAPPGWVVGLANRLPEKWREIITGPPRAGPQPLSGQIIWRKHWMNLLRRTLLPNLLLLFALFLAWFGLNFLGQGPLGIPPSAFALPWLLMFAVAVGWWLYRYVDWRNDIYVVTDDKLIDIEALPLGLYTKRRETSLDRVQTVDYKQAGIIRYFLNYGDVVIRTAALEEGFDFLYVPNPRFVQAVIFQKLDTYRRKQDQQRLKDRQREMIESLEVYHELREER